MDGEGGTCVELALEGERLCKAGDCSAGVQYFEAAVRAGTDDLRMLSAIYSQLGNAYFYLQDYERALEYHNLDLELARAMADKSGEAKASGNLGNTLKVLARFDEAIDCCNRHLDISKALNDKVSIARALYNLGNVYHTKGKQACSSSGGWSDITSAPVDAARDDLLKAVEYYRANLDLVSGELNDRAAQGRAYGNLGNTYYLLGDFNEAINQHEKRLAIAKEFGDRGAERRAHSNLGNAYVYLSDFDRAAEHYKRALQTARQLGDLALEAQACYSLGSAYMLLSDCARALECHERHLQIAQELNDKLGQSRAFWSLGNAHTGLGNRPRALACAQRHLEISKEIGDDVGIAAATTTLEALQAQNDDTMVKVAEFSSTPHHNLDQRDGIKRVSMDSMDLVRMTPSPVKPITPHTVKLAPLNLNRTVDTVAASSTSTAAPPYSQPTTPGAGSRRLEPLNTDYGTPRGASSAHSHGTPSEGAASANTSFSSNVSANDEDDFFDMLSKFQGRRLDDQRTSVRVLSTRVAGADQKRKEDLMDMVAGIQGSRINNQRADFPAAAALPAEALGHMLNGDGAAGIPDDRFFEMLMRTQSSRIEEQRSSLPHRASAAAAVAAVVAAPPPPVPSAGGDPRRPRAPTVPDEDFFSLIQRMQSNRLDEQRYELKARLPASATAAAAPTRASVGYAGDGPRQQPAAAASAAKGASDRTRAGSFGKKKKK